MNRLYFGDNLKWLSDRKEFPDASVDLVHLDPPFSSNADYNVLFREPSGQVSQAQFHAFTDTWSWADAADTYHHFIDNCSNVAVVERMCPHEGARTLTEAAVSDILTALEMKDFMQNRTLAILPVMLAVPISLCAGPLAAQPVEASRGHDVANEVYAPSLTPAIYLINFLFLYMANPDLAAYLPAYKAPIPQPVVDCLEQNPTGCPWADYRRYFDEQVFDNRECFWPDVCQENARWAHLAPRKVRQPEQINEPLGRTRADQLAHLLGMDEGMVLTPLQYHCLIGIPPRSHDREIIFRCIYNLTNSNGNAAIPLSSYGLNVTEQGDVRSVCAPDAPCLEFNFFLAGAWQKLPQSADSWRSFCAWKPKRRFFSSSKMGILAKRVANRHASSKPPARETDTRKKAAPTRFATTSLVRPVFVEALPRAPVSYGSAQF